MTCLQGNVGYIVVLKTWACSRPDGWSMLWTSIEYMCIWDFLSLWIRQEDFDYCRSNLWLLMSTGSWSQDIFSLQGWHRSVILKAPLLSGFSVMIESQPVRINFYCTDDKNFWTRNCQVSWCNQNFYFTLYVAENVFLFFICTLLKFFHSVFMHLLWV